MASQMTSQLRPASHNEGIPGSVLPQVFVVVKQEVAVELRRAHDCRSDHVVSSAAATAGVQSALYFGPPNTMPSTVTPFNDGSCYAAQR